MSLLRRVLPRVLPPEKLSDEGLCIEGGMMGAPTITVEKLSAGEAEKAFTAAAKVCGPPGIMSCGPLPSVCDGVELGCVELG
jgi:DUF917 family protein